MLYRRFIWSVDVHILCNWFLWCDLSVNIHLTTFTRNTVQKIVISKRSVAVIQSRYSSRWQHTDFRQGSHCCHILVPNIKFIIQHMDQGVAASLKWYNRTDLFRTLADANDNLVAFWEKITLLSALYGMSLGMVHCTTSNTCSIVWETSSGFRRWFLQFLERSKHIWSYQTGKYFERF